MNQDIKQGNQQGRNWYAVQTNPGYENTVLKNLRNAIESWGVEDQVFNVVVPTKKITKLVRGKEKEVEEKIYPGYVLVDMIVNDKTWWIVRNTPRVSGFLGTGVHPVPVSDTEMATILDAIQEENNEIKVDLEVGEEIKITGGAFNDHNGKILILDTQKAEAIVSVEFFGKETEVTVPISQIKKI